MVRSVMPSLPFRQTWRLDTRLLEIVRRVHILEDARIVHCAEGAEPDIRPDQFAGTGIASQGHEIFEPA